MKRTMIWIVGTALAVLCASAATAAVTVTHSTSATGTLAVNDTFTVDVTVGYDGSPVFTGIFLSAGWDPAQLSFVSATEAPFLLFGPGANGFLSRLSDVAVFPGDPAGTIRTIQYGAGSATQSANAGPDTLITTLTFSVIGAGDGTAEIDIVFNTDDVILGDAGPINASSVLTNVSVAVPEPSSFALAFSVLGTVGLIGRWRGRRD